MAPLKFAREEPVPQKIQQEKGTALESACGGPLPAGTQFFFCKKGFSLYKNQNAQEPLCARIELAKEVIRTL